MFHFPGIGASIPKRKVGNQWGAEGGPPLATLARDARWVQGFIARARKKNGRELNGLSDVHRVMLYAVVQAGTVTDGFKAWAGCRTRARLLAQRFRDEAQYWVEYRPGPELYSHRIGQPETTWMQADYEKIKQAIEYVQTCFKATDVGTNRRSWSLSPAYFQRVFRRWAGVSQNVGCSI